MKKLSLAVLTTVMLSACTTGVFADKGNATILSSKYLSDNVAEFVVQKDDGELVMVQREYHSHPAVGARVNVIPVYNQESTDSKTITRYDFKLD